MFELVLFLCMNAGNGVTVCESQTLNTSRDKVQCVANMERVMRDIKASPFYNFDWELNCSKKIK